MELAKVKDEKKVSELDLDFLDGNDVDVRAVPVDRLTSFTPEALADRSRRLDSLVATYQQRSEELRVFLGKVRQIYEFLVEQQENAVLAKKLQSGDVVRVVCSACQGTGLRPTDVFSGRVHKQGSAFESLTVKAYQETRKKIDPELQCETCEGKCWVLMERFKG